MTKTIIGDKYLTTKDGQKWSQNNILLSQEELGTFETESGTVEVVAWKSYESEHDATLSWLQLSDWLSEVYKNFGE